MMHLAGPGVVWIDDLQLEEIHADGTATEVQRPEVPPEHALMRRWVDLFAGEGRLYLLHGRMLHPPRLEVQGAPATLDGQPAVLHNAFQAPDGRQAVVIVNATSDPRHARLTWRGEIHDLTLAAWEVRLVQ
jgi:hypothetical protein